jgi:AraC family transcriptional regulator
MSDRLSTHCEHYATGAFAPYLREHRLAGAVGDMIEVAQPPGDFSDPPVRDFVLIRAVCGGMRQRSDLGGGRFEGRGRAGDLFLVPPEKATDILVHDPHVIRCFAFRAAILRPYLEEARPGRAPFDFGRLHAGAFRNPFILGLLDSFWADAARGDPPSRLLAEGAMLAILGALLRESGATPRPVTAGLAPWQVRRVERHVADRLSEELSLAELAALVGLSPWHFARAFKASTGEPPHRYLMERRIARAKELLAGTTQPITEIAHACGFASSQHLATVFRRVVGTTPSGWRRERRG